MLPPPEIVDFDLPSAATGGGPLLLPVSSYCNISGYGYSEDVAGTSAVTALAIRTVKVDISHLLGASDSNEPPLPTTRPATTSTTSVPPITIAESIPPYSAAQASGTGGKRSMPSHPSETPAKKQSKWSPEEDALIIDLRGGGMKWEDISKRLPGRSAISCRLHYQNYLERRSEWDEERKNKLARLYERFKPEMWAKVAEEMGVPWRAAEAMHWQLGEADMARRAGVVPFSLSSAPADAPAHGHARPLSSRGHSHSQSLSSPTASTIGSSVPSSRYYREGPATRSIAARRQSMPRTGLPTSPSDGYMYGGIGMGQGMGMPVTGGPPMLPSVAEMTTGMSPYSTPAYSVSASMAGGQPRSSPGSTLPSIGYALPPNLPAMPEGKSRSPDLGHGGTRRRQDR
ncbi:hypothetical protein V500_11304 [Pseudogymnoascus sp. VKM F-4518 (FW-2643)]|nr:hypothetical protein V500_11304 [Pseudogymnoascus sp. VKM F-4518 (FW-2643)]